MKNQPDQLITDEEKFNAIPEEEKVPSGYKEGFVESFRFNLKKRPLNFLFKEGKERIEDKLGVLLVPNLLHKQTCYLEILKVALPFSIGGLCYPEGFSYYRPMNVSEFDDACNKWNGIIYDLPADSGLFWYSLLGSSGHNTVTNDLQSYNLKKFKTNQSYVKSLDGINGFDQKILIDPAKNLDITPRAYVPSSEWLDSSLSKLKPEHLLTLFPEAERKQFMLFLGRTLVGRDMVAPLDPGMKPINHKYRKMCVIYGSDPGTGKSTMCESMIKAMKLFGYKIGNFRSIGEKFNMGDIYTSDLAFKDDNTAEAVTATFNSDSIKSLVTGSTMRVEDKGVDAFEVNPLCSVMFLTNQFDQSQLFNTDVGVIDRLCILYTHTKQEMDLIKKQSKDPFIKESPDLRPHAHLPWLAKRLGVDESAMWASLFRQSVDYFLELHSKKGLEKEIALLTSYQRFPISHSYLQNVVSAMHIADLVCTPMGELRTKTLLQLNNKATLGAVLVKYAFLQSDPRAHWVRNIIKQDWVSKGRPNTHPWNGIKLISGTSVKRMLSSLEQNSDNKYTSVDELIKKTFSSLSTLDGILIGCGKTYVKRCWANCVSDSGRVPLFDLSMKIHEEMSSNVKLKKAYEAITNGADPIIDHVEYTGFRPDNIAEHLDSVYDSCPEDYSIDFVKEAKRFYQEDLND